MRKITKSSLAELKESLPVLSEQEKAEYVGGDYYFLSGYYASGNAGWLLCVENTGVGDEIRFIKLDQYSKFWSSMTDSDKKDASVGINHSSVRTEAVHIVLSNMLANNPYVQRVEHMSGVYGLMWMAAGGERWGGVFSLMDNNMGIINEIRPYINKDTFFYGDSSTLPLTVAGFNAGLAGSGVLNPNLPEFNGPGATAIRAIPGM